MSEYTVENFGEKMKALRGSRSLREIEELSGLHLSGISKTEKGQSLLGSTARRLAETYGVPEAELDHIQAMWDNFAEERHKKNVIERQHAKAIESGEASEDHSFLSSKPWNQMA